MRVVVAGGSGMIGRALCFELRRSGHQVVVLSRRPGQLRGDIRAVGWNPPALGAWTAELAGADAVVNLAGQSVGHWRWTARHKRALRASRLTPTRTLVAAMAVLPPDHRPRVLVSASGTDLYEGRDAAPAGEHTPEPTHFLGRLCRDWEREASAAEPLGVRVVLTRISLVVDRGAPSLRLLALPFRAFVGGVIGSGRQWVSWIDIDDVVQLIVLALESDKIQGPLNLAAPDPRPQADFARALGAALHRPSWFRTPAWMVGLALGEESILALGSRRVWPARALAVGYRFAWPNLEGCLDARLSRRTSSRRAHARILPRKPHDPQPHASDPSGHST